MHGIEVKPKSLFEAQLAFRLAAADTTTNSISGSSISPERVKVYPNPFMDEIQVYLSKTVNLESVELISMDNKGVAISYTENSEGIVVQPEQNLAAGIYFVRLKSKGEYINIKVFKH
jgi:lipoprotein signal peptidase